MSSKSLLNEENNYGYKPTPCDICKDIKGKMSGKMCIGNELNPNYDIDDQTAKLAASLVHYVIHKI